MSNENNIKYWSSNIEQVMEYLQSSPSGLTEEEAKLRLKKYGKNTIDRQKKTTPLMIFINQFKNPIIIILIIAKSISAVIGSWIDSIIILAIVIASVVLSFFKNIVQVMQLKNSVLGFK